MSLSEKRPRDDDGPAGRDAKREKQQDSDEEMELEDDDDESAPVSKGKPARPRFFFFARIELAQAQLPRKHNKCLPTPNSAGQPVKMAQILYETPQLAAATKENLGGFALKKGWVMSISYV